MKWEGVLTGEARGRFSNRSRSVSMSAAAQWQSWAHLEHWLDYRLLVSREPDLLDCALRELRRHRVRVCVRIDVEVRARWELGRRRRGGSFELDWTTKSRRVANWTSQKHRANGSDQGANAFQMVWSMQTFLIVCTGAIRSSRGCVRARKRVK